MFQFIFISFLLVPSSKPRPSLCKLVPVSEVLNIIFLTKQHLSRPRVIIQHTSHSFQSCRTNSLTILPSDAPEAQKPGMPINVTVDAVSGGWVIRWKNPLVMPLYYTIEKKEDSQSAEWEPLTDHKIDPEEASYLSKILNTEYETTFFCKTDERNPGLAKVGQLYNL